MYVAVVPNRTSPPAILFRVSERKDGKVVKRTIANLTGHITLEQVPGLRALLKGRSLVEAEEAFEIVRSQPHGHVHVVMKMMKKLGLRSLLPARGDKERRLREVALAMVAARVIEPGSKLQTQSTWSSSSLASSFGVQDATVDEMYAAMDWLLSKQTVIERGLAKRHLSEGGHALFDLTSTWYEGKTCPLAARGYSRDGRKGTLQVNFGLLTDPVGRPVAVSVFEGNTNDFKTFLPQAETMRESFGLERFTMVGDRGMISSGHIETLKEREGIGWITAMRSDAIRKLISSDALQLDLFDDRDLFSFTDAAYPGERLVACRNPRLADRRSHKRESMLEATAEKLDAIVNRVAAGRLTGAAAIGVAVGKAIGKHKMEKHIEYTITDESFVWSFDEHSIANEKALDGIYVVRANADNALSDKDLVRSYKKLTGVERAFRSMKTLDLHVRPIFHRTEERVRAHIFLCTLSYYVLWHLRDALRPLTFTDEEPYVQDNPVDPAERSDSARQKLSTRQNGAAQPVRSFRALLTELAGVVRNHCRYLHTPKDAEVPTFPVETTPNEVQRTAFELIDQYQV